MLLAVPAALLLAVPAPLLQEIELMHGYLGVPNDAPGPEYGGGFSMYVAAWPLLEEWPGSEFQTGLFGTWMHAQDPEEEPEGEIYSDIEGGLGWWRDTRFATATPKFIMGGVTLNFATWANGPGAGKGRDWDEPRGKYGIAQLSPHVVWPPDGLNLAQGTCGELFGYGYLPLPLIDAKETTAGAPVPTGDQSWTLFLNTANFSGPVAFFTPFFFAEATVERPDLAGVFLDAMPANPGRALQMETQFVPAAMAESPRRRRTVARVAPTRFPQNADDASMLVHRITSYERGALFDDVRAWFDGGAAASGAVPAARGAVHTIRGDGWSTWKIHPRGVPRDEQRAIAWDAFATPCKLDDATFGYRWSEEWVARPGKGDAPLFTLPEWYARERPSKKGDAPRWTPIARKKVASRTRKKLDAETWTPEEPHRPEPYVTPTDGVWAEPGAVAGPFETTLGDGSVVTYAWYRFADQPALQNADLSAAEREELQRRAELLHREWRKDGAYLPPPTRGTLASLDPALLVEPPEGLKVGYVPICTRQGYPEERAR